MFVERSPKSRANAAALRLAVLVLAALVTPRLGQAQGSNPLYGPEAEFHMARLIHTAGGDYRGGYGRPWWAIDYPAAEYHFNRGLRRLTRLEVADDSIFLQTSTTESSTTPGCSLNRSVAGNCRSRKPIGSERICCAAVF